MSTQLARIALASFCLIAISACDSKQAPVAAQAVAPVTPDVASAESRIAPATTDTMAETVASADSFLLDTAATSSDTLQSLRTRYGQANVIQGELPGAEGETAQGWIIFPNEPDKKLMVYLDESDSHPGSLLVDEASSKWHLSNSIKLGTDSKTLQSLNQKVFTFYGFYWDYGGVITDWNKGELDKKTANGLQMSIHLCPPEDPKLPNNYLSGDGTFNSDNPMAQKFSPVVCQIGLFYPDAGGDE